MAVRTAYDGLAEGWDRAAGLVYRPFARSLVAASPVVLAGRRVLDVGSGTGAVAQVAAAAGARVLAVDRSVEMLSFGCGGGRARGRGLGRGLSRGLSGPAVAGDVLALPFSAGAFDVAVAGFLLNHLPPAPALAELVRVVGPGGAVLASTWAADRPDPVKVAFDAVLTRWGWVPPAWYLTMKATVEPVSGDPARLTRIARQLGLVGVRAAVHAEDLGGLDPHGVVGYRLALPQFAPWVGRLAGPARAELVRQALVSIRPFVGRWRPTAVLLTGRVADQPSRRPAARSNASA